MARHTGVTLCMWGYSSKKNEYQRAKNINKGNKEDFRLYSPRWPSEAQGHCRLASELLCQSESPGQISLSLWCPSPQRNWSHRRSSWQLDSEWRPVYPWNGTQGHTNVTGMVMLLKWDPWTHSQNIFPCPDPHKGSSVVHGDEMEYL